VLKLFKFIFPLIAFLFIGRLIYNYWPEVVAADWEINSSFLFVSMIGLVLIFFLDAAGWWLILLAMGEKVSVTVAISIWFRSSISRYIPGVIWVYASRIVLLKEYGVSSQNCIKSIIFESIMLALGSFTIGLPVLLSVLFLDLFQQLVLGSMCIAVILWGLTESGLMFFSRMPLVGRYLDQFPVSGFNKRWQLYFLYTFMWACFSVVFIIFLLSINIHFDSVKNAILAGCAFSASFCIGFILIVFPGGLGIREISLYGLLSSLISPVEAISISVGSRLWLIMGELISLMTYQLVHYIRGTRQ